MQYYLRHSGTDILILKLIIKIFILLKNNKQTSDNIKIEKPNHKLKILAIKHKYSSNDILGDKL
jgi:hypothetical protein